MQNLVSPEGDLRFGTYERPPGVINHWDYPLKTPMGLPIPRSVKRLRFNQFFFAGISAEAFMAGLAVVDLKFLKSGFIYLFDKRSGKMVEERRIALPGENRFIAPDPERGICRFRTRRLSIEMEEGEIRAEGDRITLRAETSPGKAEPLRLLTRAGYRGWAYTEKRTPLSVAGSIRVDGKEYIARSPDAMALTDWTGGFMRRETFWNWAAIAGVLPCGRPLGMNLSCGVNETGFTENGFWVDGAFTPVDTVNFRFDGDNLDAPWEISSRDGRVALKFIPRGRRSERINALVVATRFTQLFGEFEGTLRPPESGAIPLKGCFGWAEDHYAKW